MQLDSNAIKELYHILQSPTGQQLISMLQQKGGKDLEAALNCAQKGNYAGAQSIVASILNNPDAEELLKQLGR